MKEMINAAGAAVGITMYKSLFSSLVSGGCEGGIVGLWEVVNDMEGEMARGITLMDADDMKVFNFLQALLKTLNTYTKICIIRFRSRAQVRHFVYYCLNNQCWTLVLQMINYMNQAGSTSEM